MSEKELADNLAKMEWEVYEVPPLTLRMVFTPQQIEILLPMFRSYAATARAGMREACAGHGHTFLNGDCLEQCICGHILGPKDMTWEQIQEAQREHIRSLPDLAADEVIERIKREARLEEAKHWQEKVRSLPWSALSEENRQRIAALSGKETEHD